MVSLTTRQRASGLARANTPEKSGCIWQGVEREREREREMKNNNIVGSLKGWSHYRPIGNKIFVGWSGGESLNDAGTVQVYKHVKCTR